MFGQRGSGKIGLLFWMAVMGAGVFAATRCVPVKVAIMQFHDYANERTQFTAAKSRPDPAKLIKDIQDKALELDIPLEKDAIRVDVSKADVITHVKHKITVDLEVYEWTWEFNETFKHLRL